MTTIIELLSYEKYDTTLKGTWTQVWKSGKLFHVSSKKTLNGAYSVLEYVGEDEQEAVAAFMASEDKHGGSK